MNAGETGWNLVLPIKNLDQAKQRLTPELGPTPRRALVEAMEESGYDSLWVSDSAGLGGLSPLPTLAAK